MSKRELPQITTKTEKREKRGKRRGRLELRSGKWYALFMVNGVRHCKNTGTADRDEAERILEDTLKPYTFNDEEKTARALVDGVREIGERREVYETEHAAIALGDIFEKFKENNIDSSASEDRISDYGSKILRFVNWAKKFAQDVKTMQQVDGEHVKMFMRTISDGLSNNSFNKYSTMLSYVWRTLADVGKIETDPWARVRRKKLNTHSRRELTVEELSRVMSSVSGEMKILFALGMYTGLRLGDCIRMEWASVDMIRGMIDTVNRKTGRRVMIPIHAALMSILSEVSPRKTGRYLIPGIAKRYAEDDSSVVREIGRVFESCGIQTSSKGENERGRLRVDVGFHSLRHTFVSMAANAGASFGTVQAIVGHSSIEMTRHYYHENADALRKTVDTLPDITGTSSASNHTPCKRMEDLIKQLQGLDENGLKRVETLLRQIEDENRASETSQATGGHLEDDQNHPLL